MPQLYRLTTRSLAAVALSLTLLLGACGGSGDSSTTTTSGGVPLDLVVLSLPIMVDHGERADGAAQQGDFETAIAEYAITNDTWRVLRSSVRKADADAYAAIQAAQALILDAARAQDADRVAKGVADQAAVIDAFIKENGK